jgi:AmmeMemoRadiSam system protein B
MEPPVTEETMKASVRETAVAGAFYPMHPGDLQRQLDRLVPAEETRHRLLACISPHAGYVYSGGVAGRLFGHLDLPERIVVMGPNHTGVGASVAVAPHAEWDTPLGPQPVDRELAERIQARFPEASPDAGAHWKEHSIEVQLPFLRKRRGDIRVLPICLKHLDLEACLRLGRALAEVVAELEEPVGIVASSDMTHYQPDEVARSLDRKAIDAALARDPAALYEVVHREGITMCGVIPATIALEAANQLGATDAHLVAYATSGDTSGDYSAVVGYAGVCIHA